MNFLNKINNTLIEYKINKIYSKRFSKYREIVHLEFFEKTNLLKTIDLN